MARDKYPESFKLKIVEEYLAGNSQISLSKKYNINKSIISRLIKKYRINKNVKTVHCGGAPRKTDERLDKKIIRTVENNPFMSSKTIVEQLNLNIDSSTVRRRAIAAGLKSFRPAKKPMLRKIHLQKRLNFANKYLNWSVDKWKTVLFSDESKFNLINSDGMCTVRRRAGKRLLPRHCKVTAKHGGGSIMVWTCFSGFGTGPFHQIEGIMDRFSYKSILQDVMLPFAEEEMPLRWVFQHDNDPKHTSKLVKEWLEENRIQVLDWPAQSPDLNPIENLFGILKRRVSGKRFSNKTQLFESLQHEWNLIPKETLDKLIASMPRRCVEVLRNKGYYTKY